MTTNSGIADLARIEVRIGQMLEIARRYNDPDYDRVNNRASDIFHGGIFVYAALKQGIIVDVIKNLLQVCGNESGNPAQPILERMLEAGADEFQTAGSPITTYKL